MSQGYFEQELNSICPTLIMNEDRFYSIQYMCLAVNNSIYREKINFIYSDPKSKFSASKHSFVKVGGYTMKFVF